MRGPERLDPFPSDSLRFGCHPGVSCFTDCCGGLTLMLTPYDILRLARRLGKSTSELLDEHAVVLEEPGKLPRVYLEMRPDDGRCPFVGDEGCTVYEDRPGACRAYPLARAASPSPVGEGVREAFFVVRETHCKGFDAGPSWTPKTWVESQGLAEYNERNDEWLAVLAKQARVFQGAGQDRKVEMFNLASYDLDGFRRFVLDSGLTDRLSLSPRLVEGLRTNDEKLLRFAVRWLRFALYGEMCLTRELA